MRILTVAPYYKPAYVYGGPTRSVAALCEGMQRVGAQVTVYTTNANGSGMSLDVPLCEAVNIDNVSVTYFPVVNPAGKLIPFYSPKLYRACKERIHQFDIVYIVGNWTYSVFAAAHWADSRNVPYIISPRGALMDYSIGQKALKKKIYLFFIEQKLLGRAASFHVSSKVEEMQLAKMGLHQGTIIIPNPVDLARFERLPPSGRLRNKLAWPPDAIISLYVGRLHKQKRISLTIQAFAHVSHANPNAYLLMVGPDDDGSGSAAERQAEILGISKKVHFAGLLQGSELLEAYADANLLVLFSHSESFGMVVAEAMAAGLPVLISEEIGLAAEAKDLGAGVVVYPIVEEIVPTWVKMIEDIRCLRQMGQIGKSMARNNFEIECISARMLEHFAEIIRSKNLTKI